METVTASQALSLTQGKAEADENGHGAESFFGYKNSKGKGPVP